MKRDAYKFVEGCKILDLSDAICSKRAPFSLKRQIKFYPIRYIAIFWVGFQSSPFHVMRAFVGRGYLRGYSYTYPTDPNSAERCGVLSAVCD